LLGGKDASGFDDFSQGAVERLNGIGGINGAADLGRKGEKGRDMHPVLPPGLADGGKVGIPFFLKSR